MSATDVSLVLDALDGNSEAFGKLYDRHAKMIRAICYDRSRDHHAASDLTQEVFMRAFEKLDALRNHEKFSAWVWGIARQVCLEWRRGMLREIRCGVDPKNLPLHEGDQRDRAEESERLRDLLLELPERERLALHAFYLYEQDVETARLTLGLSRSGFYQVLAKARKRLQKMCEMQESA